MSNSIEQRCAAAYKDLRRDVITTRRFVCQVYTKHQRHWNRLPQWSLAKKKVLVLDYLGKKKRTPSESGVEIVIE